jgi:hypothetical protein
MAKMNYNTIVADSVNEKQHVGARNDTVLKGIFVSSPLYANAEISVGGEGKIKLTAEELKKWFIEHVVNGAVPGSDGYYGFTENYNRDFSGAGASIPNGPPDFNKDVKTGGGGLPATPFVPNPASPGEGNGISADKVPAAKEFAAKMLNKKPSTPGSGAAANDSSRNPSESSKAMKTVTLGQSLGESPASAKKK